MDQVVVSFPINRKVANDEKRYTVKSYVPKKLDQYKFFKNQNEQSLFYEGKSSPNEQIKHTCEENSTITSRNHEHFSFTCLKTDSNDV